MRFRIFSVVALCLAASFALAQESQTPAQPLAKEGASTRLVSPKARLAAAKNVYLKNLTKNDFAFEIVQNAMLAWPRFLVVDSQDKADITIEVSAPPPPEKHDDTKMGGGVGGRDTNQSNPSKDYVMTDPNVRLMVRDAHSKALLWNASEPVKDSLHQSKIDDSIIDGTNKLIRKLKDAIEPSDTPLAK